MTQPLDLDAIVAMPRAEDIDVLAAEIRRLRARVVETDRKLAHAERIRENADFHLGQEMARRQLAEKEADRLRDELAAAREQGITDAADWLHEVGETGAAYLLRTVDVPAAEETHVVADDSDDPEHIDDCPGCETAPAVLPAAD